MNIYVRIRRWKQLTRGGGKGTERSLKGAKMREESSWDQYRIFCQSQRAHNTSPGSEQLFHWSEFTVKSKYLFNKRASIGPCKINKIQDHCSRKHYFVSLSGFLVIVPPIRCLHWSAPLKMSSLQLCSWVMNGTKKNQQKRFSARYNQKSSKRPAKKKQSSWKRSTAQNIFIR